MPDPEWVQLRRALRLKRVENALVRESHEILARATRKLVRMVRETPPTGVSPGRQARRLQSLADRGDEVIGEAYRELHSHTSEQLKRLARLEGAGAAEEVRATVERARGVSLARLRLPTRAEFVTLVTHNPIQGASLRSWWRQFDASTRHRWRRELQMGLVRQESVKQLVERMRGVSLRSPGGLYRATAREVEVLVRTAVNETSNAANLLTYQRNDDVVQGVEWLASLDRRTCPACSALDGQRWKLDKVTIRPPVHPVCRCRLIPVVIGVPARKRTHYDEWLKQQSLETQEQVLGKKRAAIYRKHNLPLDQLIREDGGFITLDQLERRYPLARD